MKSTYPLILACYLLPTAMRSQAGALDATFGNGGIVLTDVASASDASEAIVLQPDGKVVVAGATSAGGAGSFFLARYLTDGSPDPTFGTFGKVTTQITTQGDGATDLLLRPDGKLIAAGFSNGGAAGLTVVQYHPDGTLDASFGTGGVASFPVAFTLQVEAALQSDGRIVCVSNYEPTFDLIAIRLNIDGGLDDTYGNNGSVIYDSGTGRPEHIQDVIAQSDDKVVVVAWTDIAFSNKQTSIARITTDGMLDNTFSIDGTALIDFHPGNATGEYMACVQQQSNQSLIFAGDDVLNGNSVIRIARLFPDGSMDLAFGTGGSIQDSIPGSTVHAYGIGLQADGKAIVAGTAYDGIDQNIAVWRTTTNGTVDNAFGTGGSTTTNIGATDVTRATAVGVDRAYVTGRTNPFSTNDVFVAAYGTGLTVGVMTPVPARQMSFWPNPARGHVRCMWDMVNNVTCHVTITDISGRLARAFTIVHSAFGGPPSLDLAGLQPGPYVVHMVTPSEYRFGSLIVE